MRHVLNITLPTVIAIATLFTACVESHGLPELILPVEVPYPTSGKVFLVNTDSKGIVSGGCTELVDTKTSTAWRSTATSTRTAVNCFVKVTVPRSSKTLSVDPVETTNELFQFCVDSESCVEPKPAKAEKEEICASGQSFDRCPVVSVPLLEARDFCTFVGRRLPTGIEHAMIRQMVNGGTYPANAAAVPAFVGGKTPASCNDAHLGGTLDCGKPKAVATADGKATGAATGDRLAVTSTAAIFDLAGSVSEWTSDQTPKAWSHPWFCVKAVTGSSCPEGAACVWGEIYDGEEKTVPVCITSPTGRFKGSVGAVSGGSWKSNADAAGAGTFARTRIEETEDLDSEEGRAYGIRCVGSSADEDEQHRLGVETCQTTDGCTKP